MKTIPAFALALLLVACSPAGSTDAVPGETVYFGNEGLREALMQRLAEESIPGRITRDGGVWFPASHAARVHEIQAEMLAAHLRATSR